VEVKQWIEQGVTIALLAGEINIDTVEVLEKTFNGFISEGTRKVVLNFSDVDYIDSMGMASIVKFLRTINDVGGKVVLSNVSVKIMSIFRITKVDTVFDIFDQEEDAVEGIKE